MSRQAGRATGNNGRDCASLNPLEGGKKTLRCLRHYVPEEQVPSLFLQTLGALGP